ncbi:TcpD family membrane protein [Streptococcus sp. H31]|uniref:TcpD family membrane protein n=1 Tax=Streptococcus huangxiaojuni TaxID=3237239 RepID=UPI0034A4C1E9
MTLENLWDFLVQNFINWCIYGYVAIEFVKSIAKGQIGKIITTLIIGAAAYTFANGPSEVMSQVGGVIQKIFNRG